MKLYLELFLLLFFLSISACRPKFNIEDIEKFVAVDYKNPSTAEVKEFEKGIERLISEYNISGLSVILIKDGSITYRNGFGYSDIENKIRATSQTPYRIASLTKPISSTILMQLNEEGKLNLEDTIKNFVDGYEDYFSNVKQYILDNEPQWIQLVENYDYKRNDITIWHHLTHTAEGVPGTNFKYNGFIFGTLSKVMEEKSGKEFAVLLKERIFEPLDMDNTIASQSHQDNPIVLAALAKPYKFRNNEFEQSQYPEKNVNAGAGIISSVEDLAKFDIAMNTDKLVKKNTKELIWQNQVTNNGDTIPYGLGWFVQEINGAKVVFHYGWQPEAYSGLYIKLPRENQTMIMMSNCENLSAPFVKQGFDKDLRKSPFAQLFLETFKNK